MSEHAPGNREFFQIGKNYYATISVDEHLETLPLRFRVFKGRLSKLFYRAKRTDKIEDPADSGKVELVPVSDRPVLPWRWWSRASATGILICAFLAVMFLLYGYRGQFGELLIQLGERLEVKPTLDVVVSSPTRVPVLAPQASPQRQVALPVHVPIPASPGQKLFSPPLREAAEPRQVDLGLGAPATQILSTSLMTSLPMSPVVPVPNLTSSEPVELAQLEVANYSPRDPREIAPSYTNSSAGKYFDVGKFRDGFRANQAMGELGQLGFHSIIVHSRVLWMNSYHILVGPYVNQGEVEAARNSLQSRGFNPRVLQSKSMHFSVPPMTLYGSDLTIRDCVITWELNSPDATVQFMQGRNVVAKSKGRWEKRDFAFKTDAVVSRENERGPETLLEIQRAGTDQGLVLDGSILRFYMGRP
jgi:cell division protein FtsN